MNVCRSLLDDHDNRYYEDEEIAKHYLKYRMGYSDDVAKSIVAFVAKKKPGELERALDVGCGSGQLTRFLAPYFASVVGADISPAQVKTAQTTPNPDNVTFTVGTAEELPAADSTLDLVTSATASHYFDWVAFPKEVDRALAPNGCLAIVIFHLVYIDHPDPEIKRKLTESIDAFSDFTNDESLKASTPIAYLNLKPQCESRKLPIPYQDQESMHVDVKTEMSVADFIECNKSYAMHVQYLADNPGTTRYDDFQKRIMALLGGGDPGTTMVKAWYTAVITCARKPALSSSKAEDKSG